MKIRDKRPNANSEILEVYMAYMWCEEGFDTQVIYMCISKPYLGMYSGLSAYNAKKVEVIDPVIPNNYVCFHDEFAFGFQHPALANDHALYESLVENDPGVVEAFLKKYAQVD